MGSWEPRNTVVTILVSHTGGPGFDSRTGHNFFRLRTLFCLISFYSREPSRTNSLVKSASTNSLYHFKSGRDIASNPFEQLGIARGPRNTLVLYSLPSMTYIATYLEQS